jgi:methionyl-tRNA formyltransferase
MRLILFGTGPFAVPTFQSLIESSDHEVLALVTRPIADGGKRRKTAENPTRDLGESAGLTIFDPASCNDDDFVAQLVGLSADLFVVCDYGQILSRECLAAAKKGGINLHGSLLPKYRGAAPINWCIYNGDKISGITIIHMTAKLDGGPCLAKAETEIGETETTEELEPRLSELGVQPVHDSIAMLKAWDGESAIGEVQDRKLATKAPRLKKSDGELKFDRSAEQLVNQVRAFQPWPGSFVNWTPPEKNPIRLIVFRASVAKNEPGETEIDVPSVKPGQVAVSEKDRLWIATTDGYLSIDEVQPAGKRRMPVADFLRGNRPGVGEQMGS